MKRLIMTIVMAAVMSMTVSAQRIDNTIKEARILTDKMVEEANLNNWQREKAKKEVLGEGLPIYDGIDLPVSLIRRNNQGII
jgi:hypothetical protein